MRLTDLLQLIDDLNLNTQFYLKIDGKTMPWSKLTLAGEQCLLYPGKKALTKAKIVNLVGKMHSRGIPLIAVVNNQEYPLFGLQIVDDSPKAILL
ncbi:hypothetical protein [uncultured Lactobacillus sp.]|uniref:hypothetical protein n=1 Tax=uncultured Lactobacillus sp. TaxID=153152 RepID=UPI0028046262|nr:hypothetical protein [uncultured Lactobacillus sp.]